MNGLAVVLSVSAFLSPQSPGHEKGEDFRVLLQRHFEALCVVSATGVRNCDRFSASNPESENAALRKMYNGSTLEWRWSGRSCYEAEKSPAGGLESARLYRDGVSFTYSVSERHVGKERFYSHPSDLSPDAYFLRLGLVPFRHFLMDAKVESPGAEDSKKAKAVLLVRNPVLKDDQILRVVLAGDPLRVIETSWSYQLRKGGRVTIERIRYSDWVNWRGQKFPLLHTKEFFGGPENYAVRSLRLGELGTVAPPEDLTVPSGTTFFDPDRGGESSIVGAVSPRRLVEILTETEKWVKKNPGSRLFAADGVDLAAAKAKLVSGLPNPKEVALHSGSSNECGVHCFSLAVALQMGGMADYASARNLQALADKGLSVKQLEHAATEAGMHARAVRGNLEDLVALGRPFVVPVKVKSSDRLPRHFVLVAGSSSGVPIVVSAPDNAFVANKRWLRDYWDGSALILSRDPIRSSSWLLWIAGSLMVLVAAQWYRKRVA